MRKGQNLRQFAYSSSPLKFSDHRPVYALFHCTVTIINEALRESISQEVYQRRRAEVGDLTHLDMDDTEDEDLIGYDAIEPGLPPASSDQQKWWLGNKQPARADVKPPRAPDGQAVVLNPGRPSNPFGATTEPDWVTIPRARVDSFSTTLSTSPFEHVPSPRDLLTPSMSSAATRKAPPAFDTSMLIAKAGRLHIRDDGASAESAKGDAPPPPPRRQTGTAASTMDATQSQAQSQFLVSNMASFNKVLPTPAPPPRPSSALSELSQLSGHSKNKAPPPVARKPLHLASGPPVHPSSASIHRTGPRAADDGKPQLPARASTGFPSSNGSSDWSRLSPGRRLEEVPVGAKRAPAAPPKPAAVARGQQQAPVDLLDSLDGGSRDLDSWETLTPAHKTGTA